jgi:DNA-binding transcriptional ArsR family regulator
MQTKADLVLHPLRLRIVMALAGRQKTSRQLAGELSDIPPATLYRHIRKLAQAGILQVVEERQVRGTAEKVYTLDERTTQLSPAEMAAFSKDDHMRYFIAFTATLLDHFSRYIHHNETLDLEAADFGYHMFPLELSDEEFKALTAKINKAFAPYFDKPSRPDRRRRIFATVVIPEVETRSQAS